MDTVYLQGLRVETLIGIHPWEREGRRTVVFDLELAADCARAARADSIGDALDYAAVAGRVAAIAAASEFLLLETLAEAVARALLEEFGVPWLRLRLDKPGAVPGAAGVGVVIERGSRRG